jgi:lysophospholipase L1-like esterase
VTLVLAVLGDSIGYGQGASRPGDTIAARLTADLATYDIATTVRMHAVPGARSAALPAQAVGAAADRPDVALIIVGANDLTRFVPAEQAAADLATAVRTLRAAGTEVVVAPAPDLSVVPWVPVPMRAMVRAASAGMRQAQTGAARAAGARIADLGIGSADRFAADRSLFSADQFHPSSAGYAVIAAALAPTVREAARAALDVSRH